MAPTVDCPKPGAVMQLFWDRWYVTHTCWYGLECWMLMVCDPSGSHRSTHIACDSASRALPSQAKLQRESEPQAFASLDLKNMPIFRITGQHRRIFAEGFSGIFLWFQIKPMGFRIASEKNFFASLAIWGCAIRIALHIAVASRDLATKYATLRLGSQLQRGTVCTHIQTKYRFKLHVHTARKYRKHRSTKHYCRVRSYYLIISKRALSCNFLR